MIRDDHPESVLSSMQNVMAVLLEESEDVHEDLLSILLSTLGRDKRVSTFSYIFILLLGESICSWRMNLVFCVISNII